MNNQITTRFTTRYGCKYPIAAAGMAFAGMHAGFASACHQSGIYPAIAGVGTIPPEAIAKELEQLRISGVTDVNVNFINPYCTDAHIDLCVRERVSVVSFHWGRPSQTWITKLHDAGCAVWVQVGSADDAVAAVREGADLIIAQGSEAGGHNYGTLPTLVLVREIVDALVPLGAPLVLAAGGITDGRALTAALALGADGVWIGSRLVATEESAVHDDYKQRLVNAKGADTVRTHIFGRHHPGFNPIRVVRNRAVTEWHDRFPELPEGFDETEKVGEMSLLGQQVPLHKFTNLVPMRGAVGDLEELPLLGGQGLGSIHDIAPMRMVIDQMVKEACERIQALKKVMS